MKKMFSKKYPASSYNSRKKRKRLWFFLVPTFLVLAIILSVCLVLKTELLAVDSFIIDDSEFMEKEETLSRVVARSIGKNSFMAFLGPDNLVFWFLLIRRDFDYSRELPHVEDLKISIEPRERRVSLKINEREPFGVWCFSDQEDSVEHKNCYAFDKSGILFAESPEVYGSLILRVNDESKRVPVMGSVALPEEDWFFDIIKTKELIEEAGLSVRVVKINKSYLKEWSVESHHGTELRFSFNFIPNNLPRVLSSFSEEIRIEDVRYVDLRVPGRIYYRYR